jgi:hypothetical protein
MAGALDRRRQLTLVLGARSCPSPWLDLSMVSQKLAQHVHLLVINTIDLLFTEGTRLPS